VIFLVRIRISRIKGFTGCDLRIVFEEVGIFGSWNILKMLFYALL
jgi:hypothetical protein